MTSATSFRLLPVEATEAMLIAARDWSLAKYGQGIGNDAANGCWSVMVSAATVMAEATATEEMVRAAWKAWSPFATKPTPHGLAAMEAAINAALAIAAGQLGS